MRAVSTRGAYLRGAPFTHYSHNSHNSHYSHFMRRPHELSGMTGYTKLALQYRRGVTALKTPGYQTCPVMHQCSMTAAA